MSNTLTTLQHTILTYLHPYKSLLLQSARKHKLITFYCIVLVLQRANKHNLLGLCCYVVLYLPTIPLRHLHKLVFDHYSMELYNNDHTWLEKTVYDILYYAFHSLTHDQVKLMTDLSKYGQDKLRPFLYPGLNVDRVYYNNTDSTVWLDIYGGTENITPQTKVILYGHGGAYVFSGSRQYPGLFNHIIKYMKQRGHDCRVASLQYKLAPTHTLPAPIIDCIEAYDYLVDVMHVRPCNIMLGGDSAGGHLALSTSVQIRDSGRPINGGILLLSPWLDARKEQRPFYDFTFRDYIPKNSVDTPIHWFLANKDVNNVISSPALAELHDLPNMLVWYCEREILGGQLHPWLIEVQKIHGYKKIQKIINRRMYHVAIILSDIIGDSLQDDLDCVLLWIADTFDTTKQIPNNRPRVHHTDAML